MPSTNSKPKFNRGLAALRLNRQMQSDRVKQGIDFIHSYIEDVEGDWLENWGTVETSSKSKAKEALLKDNAAKTPQLFSKVRSILGKWQIEPPENLDIDGLVNRIIDEFADIVSSTKSGEWLYEIAEKLEEICLGQSELELEAMTRSRSGVGAVYDDDDEQDEAWLDIAEELLDEVEATWDIPEQK